jgi:hypothetical protein|tara:strand:- start:1138 stop:1728 length:591 start_codon:yes stop_codon:yes gene_type:complete
MEPSRYYSSNNTVLTTLTKNSHEEHLMFENTTSDKKSNTKIIPLLVAFALGSSNAFASINFEVPSAQVEYSINNNSDEDNRLVNEIFTLKKELSLSVASLSALLNVERKTIYNWNKNPDSKLNNKNIGRIRALISFFNSMDYGHKAVIGRFLFKKNAIREFSDAVTRREIDLDEMATLYDKYWIQIEGAYKRSLVS